MAGQKMAAFKARLLAFYKLLPNWKVILLSISVEPIAFVVVLGAVINTIVVVDGLYNSVCVRYHGDNVTFHCMDRDSWPEHIQNDVQRIVTNWDIYQGLASIIPSIPLDLFLGAWGDKNGRQINALLGLSGTVVGSFTSNMVISPMLKAPLFTLVLGSLVSGLTGTFSLVPINLFAYLSDIVSDPRTLSIRVTIVYACVNAATIVGGFLTVWLTEYLSNQTVALISFLMIATPFFYTIWRIPQIPPDTFKELYGRPSMSVSEMPKTRGSTISSRSSFVQESKHIIKETWEHTKLTVYIYFKKREGHRRSFLLLMAFFYFMIIAVFSESKGTVIQLFAYRTKGEGALSWDKQDFSVWNASSAIMGLFGSVISIYILKNRFNFGDTTVILIGMSSRMLKLLIIGLAHQTWHMYVASVAGMVADIARPGIYGFTAHLVPKNEIGKAYAAYAIMENLALLGATAVYHTIYKATLNWFAGLLFLIIAGTLLFCVMLMIWIHFQAKREGIAVPRPRVETTSSEYDYELRDP